MCQKISGTSFETLQSVIREYGNLFGENLDSDLKDYILIKGETCLLFLRLGNLF